jgi:hypothetical protein
MADGTGHSDTLKQCYPVQRVRWLSLLLLAPGLLQADAVVKNGFDLSGALVPPGQIVSGGPGRDGIPAIDRPRFTAAGGAGAPAPDDRVLGVSYKGVSKAYPVRVLNWHEVINDEFDGTAVVVTYCPLCGTGIAYLAQTGDTPLDFGVTGLLYNSDMLLYDRQTESVWSQIRNQAVAGPLKGERLMPLVLMHTRWADWQKDHPDTLVMTTETGYRRDYSRNPYAGYDETRKIWFPVRTTDDRYQPKALVFGLELAGQFKAYPFEELPRSGGRVQDTFADRRIVVHYDPENTKAYALDANGQPLPGMTAYWFAWFAFHPDTEVYTASKSIGSGATDPAP